MRIGSGDELATVEPANNVLQIADILLYQHDGDIPVGHWTHGGTYGVGDLLLGNRQLEERVMPQLERILCTDNSEDVIGRSTHLARRRAASAVGPWFYEATFSNRWRFDDPAELRTNAAKRPYIIFYLHLGFLFALHGVPEAITFMNKGAECDELMVDVAAFNRAHAPRDRDSLLASLEAKAKDETKNVKQFRPWHVAVYENTKKMFDKFDGK